MAQTSPPEAAGGEGLGNLDAEAEKARLYKATHLHPRSMCHLSNIHTRAKHTGHITQRP